MKTIPVVIKTETFHFMVDDDEYEYLIRFTWSGFKSDNRVYATTRWPGGSVLMHRAILRYFDELVVDHIDGNTLNNQKENLRVVTQSENARNSQRSRLAIGVHYDAARKRFCASTRHKGVKINLGRYRTFAEAKAAYEEFTQNNP